MRSLTDQEKAERNRQQMTNAIEGLDRAVVWIKENRENLVGGFILAPNRETGMEIMLGTIFDFDNDPASVEHIKRLFAGRSVKRTRRTDGEDMFCLLDEELRLTFRWSVHRSEKKESHEIDTVVI